MHRATKMRKILHRDECSIVEVYSPYPNAVIAALQSAEEVENNPEFHSANGDESSGLAWMIIQGDIYVWYYEAPQDGVAIFKSDADINLTDSRLVTPVLRPKSRTYGMLVVSSNGYIRVYHSATDPAAGAVEDQLDMDSETICVLLTSIQPAGVVIATSTGSLFQLFLSESGTLSIRGPLSKPSGLINSITTAIRTGLGTGTVNSLPRQLLSGNRATHTRELFVLYEGHLEKWTISERGQNTFDWDLQLGNTVKKALLAEAQSAAQIDPNYIQPDPKRLRVWLCDLALGRDGLLLLVASTVDMAGTESSASVGYTLFLIDERQHSPDILSLISFGVSPMYSASNEYSVLEELSLCSPKGGPLVSLVTGTSLEAAMAVLDNDSVPLVPPISSRFLGSVTVGPLVLVFPAFPESSLISISAVDQNAGGILPVPRTWDTEKDSELVKTNADILNLSFVAYSKGEAVQCPVTALIDDMTCIAVSNRIIDNQPAADVRWAEDHRESSEGAVLLKWQLQQKAQRHTSFLDFIHHGEKLPLSARWKLLQNGERISSALGLLEFQDSANRFEVPLVVEVMTNAVKRRGVSDPTGVLGPVDLVFAELSQLHDLVIDVVSTLENNRQASRSDQERMKLVEAATSMAISLISAARDYRQHYFARMCIPEDFALYGRIDDVDDSVIENHWLATSSFLESLSKLSVIISHQIVESSSSGKSRESLLGLMYQISDHLLDGLRRNAMGENSSSVEEKQTGPSVLAYEKRRETLIKAFIEAGDTNHAYSLAEEYHYFPALIELCERSGDQNRLERYSDKYADFGFSTSLFTWYLTNNKKRSLLEQPEKRANDLTSFLIHHPSLSWIHSLGREEYLEAAMCLKSLADNETALLARKKRYLSMAKLAVIASENVESGTSLLSSLEDMLYIVRVQELVIEDPNAAPLPVKDLIDLLLSDSVSRKQQLDKCILAHEVLHKTVLDHDYDTKRDVSVLLWRRTFELDNWRMVLERDRMNDTEVEEFLKDSAFMHVLLHGPSDLDSFSPDLRTPVLKEAGLFNEKEDKSERSIMAFVNASIIMAEKIKAIDAGGVEDVDMDESIEK